MGRIWEKVKAMKKAVQIIEAVTFNRTIWVANYPLPPGGAADIHNRLQIMYTPLAITAADPKGPGFNQVARSWYLNRTHKRPALEALEQWDTAIIK